MQKHYELNAIDGSIIAFYNSEVTPTVPDNAVEITEAEWQDAVNNAGKYIRDPITKLRVLAPPIPIIPPTYAELRATEYAKRNQFAMQYDDAKNGTTTWVDWQDAIKAAIPKI